MCPQLCSACRYEVLDSSSPGLRGGAASIARDLLEATMGVTAGLLSAETAQLAPPLCQVLHCPCTQLGIPMQVMMAMSWAAHAVS